ncbi:MAG: DUF2085 domain-containing protein [Methanobacteriaceae archaeon]|nr:DUF2085 domain-containing protein [Methanobacteriaceae archaeon]MDO9626796.1 DUF2085 domain-containing protein [Methanobacteriaceae archaeon]
MNNQFLSEESKNLSKVYICHRLPNRTFKIRGYYFPVCSRCIGMYIAAFSYFVLAMFYYINYDLTLMITALLLIIPTFIDGLTQLIGFRESNNTLRFFSGLIAGIGLAIFIKYFKIILMGVNYGLLS